MPVKTRPFHNTTAKQLIAEMAVRWISPGQTIYLDSSATVQHLAQVIPDLPLTILTNSLRIPELFSEKPAIDVIVLGGHYRATSRSCVGHPTELTSDLYHIDSAFISCCGIDARLGLSEEIEDQARLKRHLLKRVTSLYLLADSSKIGVSSFHYFAKSSDVDVWFTEVSPPPEIEAPMKSHGVCIEAYSED
jgi:DeoR/GlpR family transcriptional regulator of sugar metabolism